MSIDDLVHLGQEALVLGVLLSLPVAVVAALAGLISSLLQGRFGIHDAALSHLPRFVAVALVLGAVATWMGSQLVAFTERAWGG